MELEPEALAGAAHRAAEDRLAGWAKIPGAGRTAVRRGTGWVAVRTGIDSNDLNGVVSDGTAAVGAELCAELVSWFGGLPACWLTRRRDADLTATLLAAGARPERTGRWSGRSVSGVGPHQDAAPRDRVETALVRSPADLERWLDVAAACDWIGGADDRSARRDLCLASGWDGRYTQWLAVEGGHAVGFASSWCDPAAGSGRGTVVELVDLGVLPAHRRRGIGRTLVVQQLAAAAARGGTLVVSAPSPDGWRLQRELGFTNVPVLPDRCFYLPEA